MIHLLVGHRGVGKTSFLRRIEAYYRNVRQPVICLDLDEEVIKFQQSSIEEIFRSMGEGVFREMEQDVLNNLFELYGEETCDIYISIGAGYVGEFQRDANIIWIRRESDSVGRIFLDRPQLESNKSRIEEFFDRYQERRIKYMSLCSEEFCIEEGFDFSNDIEPLFLGLVNGSIGGCLSLLPENFLNKKHWKKFLKKRLKWGVHLFELRDDFLSEEMLQLALATIPRDQLLLSFREAHSTFFEGLDLSLFKWDWPLELGPIGERTPDILSLHQRSSGQSVFQCGERLEQEADGRDIYLKLAVEVHDLEELELGHRWWQKDPVNRSFLPRSKDGRWQWYRALHKKDMKINFFKEATGSQVDQPTFFEWCRSDGDRTGFMAILGQPVLHSRTPGFHYDYFAKKDVSTLRIPLSADELTGKSLDFLKSLGLIAAAVTSPLKATMFDLIKNRQPISEKVGAINTIWLSNSQAEWIGENTDVKGLEALIEIVGEEARSAESGFAVWGGGGTREIMKIQFPYASFFSARSGEIIEGEGFDEKGPSVLVWAVGRNRQNDCQWPPNNWRPSKVIDLNYSSDSPGLEYAIKVGAQYYSGQAMFEAQAEGQQQLWSKL